MNKTIKNNNNNKSHTIPQLFSVTLFRSLAFQVYIYIYTHVISNVPNISNINFTIGLCVSAYVSYAQEHAAPNQIISQARHCATNARHNHTILDKH